MITVSVVSLIKGNLGAAWLGLLIILESVDYSWWLYLRAGFMDKF